MYFFLKVQRQHFKNFTNAKVFKKLRQEKMKPTRLVNVIRTAEECLS